ncbi:MAG: hypothetical protein ABW168_23625 [Sedimenticola sp.]
MINSFYTFPAKGCVTESTVIIACDMTRALALSYTPTMASDTGISDTCVIKEWILPCRYNMAIITTHTAFYMTCRLTLSTCIVMTAIALGRCADKDTIDMARVTVNAPMRPTQWVSCHEVLIIIGGMSLPDTVLRDVGNHQQPDHSKQKKQIFKIIMSHIFFILHS